MVLLVAACGASPKQPLPPEHDDAPEARAVSVTTGTPLASATPLPAPPAGFATADLVTLRRGELATWSVADGTLTRLGSVVLFTVDEDALPDVTMSIPGRGGWADRDHLFLTRGEREVVMITATAITRVEIPPSKDFETPKPPDPQHDIERASATGNRIDTEGLQISERGEVFWSQCGWGRSYDGYICDAWVHAQLWPSRQRLEGPGAITRPSWTWSPAPPGFKAAIDGRRLTCRGPAGKATFAAGGEDGSEEFHAVQWVSTQPPRMLVTYGHPGLADVIAERWTLHDGCKNDELATGTLVEPGPDGLWIGIGGTQDAPGPTTLYRGARPLGRLPDDGHVMFRPPARRTP